MADPALHTWDDLWRQIQHLKESLRKSRAVNVNRDALREEARAVPQYYFREVRPKLETLGITDETLSGMDALMQDLLRLATGRNPKRQYDQILRHLWKLRAPLESERELLIGRTASQTSAKRAGYSSLEEAILRTLTKLIPSAAASYQQAIHDLAAENWVSWRGTAAELREALREVLDRLAPDKAVVSASGFKFEEGQTRPTMKQKVRFILEQRELPSGALKAPLEAIAVVQSSTASFVRSVYDRGSLAVHVAPTRKEVMQLKLYVDGVLGELLAIHG